MSIDENEGRGGSYILDPKTGARVLVERTEELVLTIEAEATLAPALPEANHETESKE